MITPALCRTLVQLGRLDEAHDYCQRARHLAPKDRNLRQLEQELGTPLCLGTIKFIRAADYGDHLFGYVALDQVDREAQVDARLDSRFVNLDGLVAGMRVQVAVSMDRWGKCVVKRIVAV